MTKEIMIALVALLVATAPVQAGGKAGCPPRGAQGATPSAGMGEMMDSPQHLLAMGYHRNLVGFARALEQMAGQGATVPPELARAAVTEMKRSMAQMEYYHSEAVRALPHDRKDGAARGTMQERHVAQMRDGMARLEEYAKADRVDSSELLKRLEPILEGAQMGRGQVAGAGEHPMKARRGGHDPGMKERCRECLLKGGEEDCRHCMEMHRHRMDSGAGTGRWQEMMQMRQQLLEEMKKQDADLARLVDRMNSASADRKQAIMAEILTRMVQQRAAFYDRLEGMQQQMKGRGIAAPGPEEDQGEDTESDDGEDAENSYQL